MQLINVHNNPHSVPNCLTRNSNWLFVKSIYCHITNSVFSPSRRDISHPNQCFVNHRLYIVCSYILNVQLSDKTNPGKNIKTFRSSVQSKCRTLIMRQSRYFSHLFFEQKFLHAVVELGGYWFSFKSHFFILGKVLVPKFSTLETPNSVLKSKIPESILDLRIFFWFLHKD
jgi:hypothetical protein